MDAGARYATHEEIVSELLDLAGKDALDVGCGAGRLTRLLAAAGARASGIDVNPAVIRRAIARAREDGADIEFAEGRAEALPWPDARFDVVVFSNSLHHVEADRMERALAEAARVLRPEGLLYVMEPVAKGRYFEATRIVNDEREVRDRARDAIRAAPGLQEEREVVYQARRAFASYEAWRDSQTDRSEKRRRIFEARDEEARQAFLSGARIENGMLVFDQMFRVNLLRRLDDRVN